MRGERHCRGCGLSKRSYTTLRELDEPRLANALKLAKQAKRDGEDNLPPSESTSISAFEKQIVESVEKHHTSVRADMQHARALHDKEITSHVSRLMDATTVPDADAELRTLTVDIDIDKHKLKRARGEVKGAEFVLNQFKARHKIFDAPSRDESAFVNFVTLFAIVLTEAAANVLFFAEGEELGILGGYLIAGGVSAANVIGFFLIGYLLVRYKNSGPMVQKGIGILSIAASLIALTAFHLGVAFYRQAKVLNSELSTNELS